jgi:hypothetical protein
MKKKRSVSTFKGEAVRRIAHGDKHVDRGYQEAD